LPTKLGMSSEHFSVSKILTHNLTNNATEIFTIKTSDKKVTFDTQEIKFDGKDCTLITMKDITTQLNLRKAEEKTQIMKTL
jgi:uncharacterized protein YacL (UPF0231 family)